MTKKKSSKQERYVMICPKCGSPDVYLDKSNPLQPAMGLPAMYVCNKCRYKGYNFPEVKLSELKGFEEELTGKPLPETKKDNSPMIDTSYGNFLVRVFWKITAPIVLLTGIFLLFKEPISGTILTLTGIYMFYTTYFKTRKLKD